MFRAATVVLLAALCVVTAACGDEPESGSIGRVTVPADVEGKSFASTSEAGTPLEAGQHVKLEFEDGRLSASVGCNRISGAYAVEDGVLRQTDAVQTMMDCGQARQEEWLGDFLADGALASTLATTLTLTAGDAKLVLKPAQRSGPPPVVGTLWTLKELQPRTGSAAPVRGDDPPTLELTADGRAEIFTGCNRGGGEATFADGFVTFGPIAVTQMACPGVVDDVEQAMLKVLDGKTAAGFSGTGDLSLAKNGDTLLFAAP